MQWDGQTAWKPVQGAKIVLWSTTSRRDLSGGALCIIHESSGHCRHVLGIQRCTDAMDVVKFVPDVTQSVSGPARAYWILHFE